MTKRDKITVDDIIGIVHTDETTNSVEEVRKLRGRKNKRFTVFQDSYDTIYIKDKDIYRGDGLRIGDEEYVKFENVLKVVDLLNKFNEENEQLQHKLSQQEMEYATTAYRQAEENEQLRKDATTLIYANQDYRHENEQLKDFIRKEFPKSYKHILEGFND